MWARLKGAVNDYQFGDITKHCVQTVTGKPSNQYQFGDITKSITHKALENVFSTWQPALTAAPAEDCAPGEADPTPLLMEDLWGSFFRQSELVCLGALQSGSLSLEDVQGLEPFMFIGLPALTLFEAILRSRAVSGLQLACGVAVTEANVPDEVAELYRAVAECKAAVVEMELTTEDEAFMRYATMFAEADAEDAVEPAMPDDDRKVLLRRRCVGPIGSIATQVTQLSFYKTNYLSVLESAAMRYETPK